MQHDCKGSPLLIFDKVRVCFVHVTHETIAKNSCRKAIKKKKTSACDRKQKRETADYHVISFHQNN